MTAPCQPAPGIFYTVGHSNRPIGAFTGILKAHGVTGIADVRKIPRSRFNPQFGIDRLPGALAAEGIAYRHFPELGGLRSGQPGSPNTGWRNASFRAYADYMQTPAFTAAVEALTDFARGQAVAVMCAEAVPWRCHRSLIADALTVRGWQVIDLLDETAARPHALTPFARVEGASITYPPPEPEAGAGDAPRLPGL